MKITDKNYYSRKANMEYMSVSQYKAFKKCEAAALAEIKGKYVRQKSTALLVGGYMDAYFDGKKAFDTFVSEHKDEIYTRNGTLRSDFEKANLSIKAIERQPQMMKYLKGEHQVIETGEICGVPFKTKIDSLTKKAIVDLKLMADFADKWAQDEGYLPWYEYWEYDIQGAVYQEIHRQNTGKTLPFILDAATKEDTPDVLLLQLPQAYLDYKLIEVEEYAPRYQAIKQGLIKPMRCEHCAYCRSTKKVKLIVPEGE